MPLLDLQLRLRQLGTLRMGELVTKNGKTYPTTRETWRVTTSDPKIAAAIAAQFGGTVVDFDSKSSEALCVDTTTAALPIAVVPGHAISAWYELWSGGGCLRRCDGFDEVISGSPCLCDPDSDKGRECKPTTRLSLVVRGIDALGLFRLNTGGWYAATELGGAVQFLEARTARGEALEGWLRIEERRVVRDGQTKVFKVPVLDVAYGLDRMLPVGETREALPNGYKPLAALAPGSGTSVEAGLAAVADPAPLPRNARSAAPIPSADDDLEFGGTPVPVPADSSPGDPQAVSATSAAPAVSPAAETPSPPEPASPGDPKKPTQPQLKKLNLLVGRLRELPDGHAAKISNAQLWKALAETRSFPVDALIEMLAGRDSGGELHFSPLRDSLTRLEASSLIDRLEAHEAKTGAPA
jgi:hypothetical protein